MLSSAPAARVSRMNHNTGSTKEQQLSGTERAPRPTESGKCEKSADLGMNQEIFSCSDWPHSRSFTTGGHGYSRLCLSAAVKDFKGGAGRALAPRLTT